MVIVPAKTSDWSNIAVLLQQASLPVDDLGPSYVDNFLVARSAASSAEVAGAIGLECFGDTGLLRSLVVVPHSQGSGAGRRLVTELEAEAARRGIAELWLLTTDADAYFTKLGYEAESRDVAPDSIRETTEFSKLCPSDAIVMRKAI